ncbi:hypothetical protein EDD92_1949 [Streptomyces sp. TLI_185]|nr:hypothetical protein EDD92_1949 [Streptomyces sp. TLI_185]
MVASVARVRQLVVVMRSVKQTYRDAQEPPVHMADGGGQASATDRDLRSSTGDQCGQGREALDHEAGGGSCASCLVANATMIARRRSGPGRAGRGRSFGP